MILNFSRDALVGLPVLKEKLGLTGSGFSLGALSDVNLVGVTDGNLLAYDAASGKWVNGAVIQLDGPF